MKYSIIILLSVFAIQLEAVRTIGRRELAALGVRVLRFKPASPLSRLTTEGEKFAALCKAVREHDVRTVEFLAPITRIGIYKYICLYENSSMTGMPTVIVNALNLCSASSGCSWHNDAQKIVQILQEAYATQNFLTS